MYVFTKSDLADQKQTELWRKHFISEDIDVIATNLNDKNAYNLISNAVIKDEKDLPTLTDFTGKRILIVDDNPLNIKVVERLLKTFNCLTDSVASGSDCISKIKNSNNNQNSYNCNCIFIFNKSF